MFISKSHHNAIYMLDCLSGLVLCACIISYAHVDNTNSILVHLCIRTSTRIAYHNEHISSF